MRALQTAKLFFPKLSAILLTGILWVAPHSAEASAYRAMPINTKHHRLMLSRFHLHVAEVFATRGFMESAAESLERVYRINPDQILAGMLYANFLDMIGEYEKAISIYEEMFQSFDEPREKSAIAFQMAFTYEQLNRIPLAIQSLETAIELFPGTPPADYYYNLGVMYARMNDYAKTVIYSQKALEIQPDSSVAWNNYGYSQAVLGNYEEGYRAIVKALELDPNNPAAIDSLGYVLMKMGRVEESITEFEKAIELDPSLSESVLHLGESHEELEQWDKALHYYQKFIEMAEDTEQKQNVEKKLEYLKSKMLSHPTIE